MLKLVFVSQDDPFFIPEFFQEFIRLYDPGEIQITGVVIQAPLGKKSLGVLARQMLEFYGPWDFFRMGTCYAFRTALGFMAVRIFRGHLWGSFSLEHILRRNGWDIMPWRNVNDPEFIHMVKDTSVDLVISVAASQKFREELLSAPRFGCINIHNSRLPRNRGMLPNFWGLYRYDREPVSGMTVHKMNATLDDGPIILQDDLSLHPEESLHRLMRRAKRLNARLLLSALNLYKQGEPAYKPNDASQATYNSFPTKTDVRAFRAKGLKLV
jgi:methionyl-tRNA formyltransferase